MSKHSLSLPASASRSELVLDSKEAPEAAQEARKLIVHEDCVRCGARLLAQQVYLIHVHAELLHVHCGELCH